MTGAGTQSELLAEDVVAEYMAIRSRDIVASKVFYFAEIMPRLRAPLEANSEHQALRAKGCDTLISLMGYSPETTVMCAIVLRPKRLIVAYSSDIAAKSVANPAIEYLTGEGILDYLAIRPVAVKAFDSNDIYAKIREEIPKEGRRIFDITGGTKLMSATAGSLAWELNLDICYLDGGWDPRSGSSGLARVSRLSVVRNPSRQRGYQIRRTGNQLYNQGNFVAAEKAFSDSSNLIDDSFFDLLAAHLCVCYQHMADFEGEKLSKSLEALAKVLDIGGVRKIASSDLQMDAHIEALGRLARREQLTRVAAFLELAKIYSNQSRHDFSSLLAYRAMESVVEYGLKRVHPDFDMSKPDYELLGNRDEIASEFRSAPGFDGLPPRVAFVDGFQLLCLVDGIHKRFSSPASIPKTLKRMQRFAERRNRSNLAHGFQTLGEADSRFLLGGAEELSKAVLGVLQSRLEAERSALRPRAIEHLTCDDL